MMNSFFFFFKQKLPQFLHHYRWGILSGVLIGTSYIPFPPWALIFCYAPLWIWQFKPERSLREVLIGAWLTQFVLTLIGFHWLAYTANEFGNFPWSLSILVLILFAGLIHIHIPISSALSFWLTRRLQMRHQSAFAVQALILVFLERFSPLMIFRWHLGYPLLWAQLPIYHFADAIGFAGLSAVTLLLNAWVSDLIASKKKTKVQSLAAVCLVFGALNLAGFLYWKAFSVNQTMDRSLFIGLEQPEISNKEKLDSESGAQSEQSVLRSLTSDTRAIAQSYPQTQIMIWPETAVPAFLDKSYWNDPRFVFLRNELATTKLTLLTGAYSRKTQIYNSLFAFQTPDFQELAPTYNKNHLLVFGEYMPMGQTFPFLYKLLPFVGDFGRGEGPIPMKLENLNLKIGPQICYEGLFPFYSAALARNGSEIIVNITNDSWYGHPFEPLQHLYMTFARAIETRLPLVRSTNSGMSGAIDATGKVLLRSPADSRWRGVVEVPLASNPQLTWFSRFGEFEYLIWLVLLVAILGHSWYVKPNANSGVLHSKLKRKKQDSLSR